MTKTPIRQDYRSIWAGVVLFFATLLPLLAYVTLTANEMSLRYELIRAIREREALVEELTADLPFDVVIDAPDSVSADDSFMVSARITFRDNYVSALRKGRFRANIAAPGFDISAPDREAKSGGEIDGTAYRNHKRPDQDWAWVLSPKRRGTQTMFIEVIEESMSVRIPQSTQFFVRSITVGEPVGLDTLVKVITIIAAAFGAIKLLIVLITSDVRKIFARSASVAKRRRSYSRRRREKRD